MPENINKNQDIKYRLKHVVRPSDALTVSNPQKAPVYSTEVKNFILNVPHPQLHSLTSPTQTDMFLGACKCLAWTNILFITVGTLKRNF